MKIVRGLAAQPEAAAIRVGAAVRTRVALAQVQILPGADRGATRCAGATPALAPRAREVQYPDVGVAQLMGAAAKRVKRGIATRGVARPAEVGRAAVRFGILGAVRGGAAAGLRAQRNEAMRRDKPGKELPLGARVARSRGGDGCQPGKETRLFVPARVRAQRWERGELLEDSGSALLRKLAGRGLGHLRK